MNHESSTAAAGRVDAFDALRAIAALAVVVLHVSFYTARAQPPWSFLDGAVQGLRLGVPLFFVLSGYLLFAPWVAATRGERTPPELPAYLLRRAARILPVYFLALAISAVLLSVSDTSRLPSVREIPSMLLLVQNWFPDAAQKLDPPAWTLCVEVSFYLLLPLVGLLALRRLTGRRRLLALCLGLIVASLAANTALVAVGAPRALHRTLPGELFAFACGMGAAVIGRSARLRPALLALLGAALVAGDAFSHVPAELPGTSVWGDLPAAAGFAMIVLAIAGGGARLLRAAPLIWVGTRSYGLYIWHYPVILTLKGHSLLPQDMLSALVMVLAISIPVAALSWSRVERPLSERARRATSRWARSRRAEGAAARGFAVQPATTS